MRISREQRDELYDMLDESRDRNNLTAHWHALAADPRVKDIGKRFRWDLLYSTLPEPRYAWINARYDEGCTDTHIDTALREWMRMQEFPFTN